MADKPTKEEPATPDPDTDELSRDAADSTYTPKESPKDVQDTPPPGPQVEQTLGKPSGE